MREEPRRPAGFRTEQMDEWREHSSSWRALGAGYLSRIKRVHEQTGKTCSSNICLNPLMLQSLEMDQEPRRSERLLKWLVSTSFPQESSCFSETHRIMYPPIFTSQRNPSEERGSWLWRRVTCRESQEGTGGYSLCVHHQDGTEKVNTY